MKIRYVNPVKDEVLVFDLPDGSHQVQVGALCPHCDSDRRMVSVSIKDREFTCSPDNVGRSAYVKHDRWPRIAHRFDRANDGTTVARVYEVDAPPFVVRPTDGGPTYRALETR